MELPPISSRPGPAVLPVPPLPATSSPARPGPQPASPGDGRLSPAPEPPRRTVGVEFAHRSNGVQVVTFIDLHTGVVISQTPAQSVLEVVNSIVHAIQRRERADGE